MQPTRSRKSSTQARGRARREALLGAARTLLTERTLAQIELSDVAALAGIPKSSAYYFYGDIHALYAELAALHDEELNDAFAAPMPRLKDWEAVIGLLIDRAADYFFENSSACQLMFGPQTPPDIKWISRSADKTHSAVFEEQIDRQFLMPEFPDRDRVFFRAVEAADLMFGLSILEFGALTELMVEESKIMACAYLRVYIPPILPRR